MQPRRPRARFDLRAAPGFARREPPVGCLAANAQKAAHGGNMVSPVVRRVSERAQQLLQIADDELVLGWRNSEWTGIAPFLEEDVAFSSIAQNEIGHARALYELAARELGTTADELAFDRDPSEYRSSQLVEQRRMDWAHTIARHYLYETADEIRLAALKESDDSDVAGLAAKMDREEQYHRLHANMWAGRLAEEPRFREALEELWPYALGLLPPEQRQELVARIGLPEAEAIEHNGHSEELRELWEEMTIVRR